MHKLDGYALFVNTATTLSTVPYYAKPLIALHICYGVLQDG